MQAIEFGPVGPLCIVWFAFAAMPAFGSLEMSAPVIRGHWMARGRVALSEIGAATLSDLPFIVRQVRAAAREGLLPVRYSGLSFCAGVLCTVLVATLFGRVRLPGAGWWRARLVVSRVQGAPVGVLLLRDCANDGYDSEIMICAVAPEQRRRGVATAMIRAEFAAMRRGAEMIVACRPAAQAMSRLLARLGFTRVGFVRGHPDDPVAPEGFRLERR